MVRKEDLLKENENMRRRLIDRVAELEEVKAELLRSSAAKVNAHDAAVRHLRRAARYYGRDEAADKAKFHSSIGAAIALMKLTLPGDEQ